MSAAKEVIVMSTLPPILVVAALHLALSGRLTVKQGRQILVPAFHVHQVHFQIIRWVSHSVLNALTALVVNKVAVLVLFVLKTST